MHVYTMLRTFDARCACVAFESVPSDARCAVSTQSRPQLANSMTPASGEAIRVFHCRSLTFTAASQVSSRCTTSAGPSIH